jgi:hypothetical protein
VFLAFQYLVKQLILESLTKLSEETALFQEKLPFNKLLWEPSRTYQWEIYISNLRIIIRTSTTSYAAADAIGLNGLVSIFDKCLLLYK